MAKNTCRNFADILGGTIMNSNDCSCAVIRLRNIEACIQGRTTESPLTLAAMFSYESPDDHGCTLNLGEMVLLSKEVNPFIDSLRENDITITSLHTHWLFDKPRLMYIYFQSIDDPISFAQKTANAFKCLIGRADGEDKNGN